MMFVTVGSMFPFDRLIKAVDVMLVEGVIPLPVFGQIGDGEYLPRNFAYKRFLTNADFREQVSRSSAIISHAGIGIISFALEYGKPLIVLPRLQRYAEHVNDHQVATARKFAQLGHLMVANSTSELRAIMPRLADFIPISRVVNARRLAFRIGEILNEWGSERDEESAHG